MCKNNKCNGGCNTGSPKKDPCRATCDPCQSQPKRNYCGNNNPCVGLRKGMDLDTVLKMFSDELCQIKETLNFDSEMSVRIVDNESCPNGFTLEVFDAVTQEVLDSSSYCPPEVDLPYIPLAGTEVGAPVTGDIEISPSNQVSIGNISNTIMNRVLFYNNGGIVIHTRNTNTNRDASMLIENNTGKIIIDSTNDSNVTRRSLQVSASSSEPLLVKDTVSNEGIRGDAYYGANYQDNTYIQKKYVSDNFIPITGTASGNPLTGSIITPIMSNISFGNSTSETSGTIKRLNLSDIFIEMRAMSATDNSKNTRVFATSNQLSLRCGTSNTAFKSINLTNSTPGISVNDSASSIGLEGFEYYGANYGANTYIQRKFVDGIIVQYSASSSTDIATQVSSYQRVIAEFNGASPATFVLGSPVNLRELIFYNKSGNTVTINCTPNVFLTDVGDTSTITLTKFQGVRFLGSSTQWNANII